MENSASRIIIETIVKKTIREIKDSPRRSIRNLVDMGLRFSNGRFQKMFFLAAQTMLQNQNSAYYRLIEDTVSNVNQQNLITFGMNVGYNSCTYGAQKIRKVEEEKGYIIPWVILLTPTHGWLWRYSQVIQQGEQLGVYTWILRTTGGLLNVLPLVSQHPDSAFVLICRPADITNDFIQQLKTAYNVMVLLSWEKGIANACDQLREAKLLYSVYFEYDKEDLPAISSGSLFYAAQKVHPVFTILCARKTCPAFVSEQVYQMVKTRRSQQQFSTVVWEAGCDCSYVDSIISSEACLAGFNMAGNLFTSNSNSLGKQGNLFYWDLPQILNAAFPKSKKQEEQK